MPSPPRVAIGVVGLVASSLAAIGASCTPAHHASSASKPDASSSNVTSTSDGGTLDPDGYPSPWDRDTTRPPRALVFRAPGFPTIDAPAIADADLDQALDGISTLRASNATELADRLRLRDVDVLVLPYGSAFPVDAWPRIQTFLQNGGGLAVLGGAPLYVPVRWENNAWVPGLRQPVFAHDLLIGPAEPITIEPGWKTYDLSGVVSGFDAKLALPKHTWALTLRLTRTKDFPDEHGSAGEREVLARPLAHIVDLTDTKRACPLLELDHVRGTRRGARWIFATTDAPLDQPTIRAIVSRALQGAVDLRVKVASATIGASDSQEVTVIAGRFQKSDVFHLTVRRDRGAIIFEGKKPIENIGNGVMGVKFKVAGPLAPAPYQIIARNDNPDAPSHAFGGFWVRDEKLLKNGPKITVSKDWLRRDGKPFPIVGTTYMASDVHRYFLFEPNSSAWDEDFAEMKRRGINFVRTGLWTAWSRVVGDTGRVDEAVLSALEAFVLTAAKHGIVVCFNFFAFLPPTYGGTNPYLDPQSIAGQTAFVKAFAARMKDVPWVHWDLINEPSYAPASKLWRTRAIGDAHEMAAWKKWVRAKHAAPNESDASLEAKLRVLWRLPNAGDVYAVPSDDDFTQVAMQIDKRPRRARDFREFTEHVIRDWTKTLRAAIREAAGTSTLVTLGQDEGGIYERALQQVFGHELDYTAVHTWWKNDDLLWDGVTTKLADKPSLHQETGLMRLEDIDGNPWRTPETAADLLDRKLGYAFAGRGAGVVEWVWNVNPYMPIDEEATIGLIRPDGTVKPELDVLQRYAEFFGKAAADLDDFESDPVVMIIPHARAFLGMTGLIDATKPVVRVLAERYGVVPSAISDLRVQKKDLEKAKLVIVPRPDVLDESAATALYEAVTLGTTKVLITGFVDGDSYGRMSEVHKRLVGAQIGAPVALKEKSGWSASGWVSFEGLLQESARRDVATESTTKLIAPGTSLWREPLPLEIAREPEPLVKLLGAALTAAKVPTSPDDGGGGVAARVLLMAKTALVIVVNERPEIAKRRVMVDGKPIDLTVNKRASRVVLVDRATGKILKGAATAQL